jgi:DeoR/GlpR family transcriptional regulator of sugar metabolism
MDYRTYSQRLEYLKELIEEDRLCSPTEVASRFDCSERTVRKMINDLGDTGLNIKYSRKNFKYFLA